MLLSKTFTRFITVASLITATPAIVLAEQPIPLKSCPPGYTFIGGSYDYAGKTSCYCVYKWVCYNKKTGMRAYYIEIVSIEECFKRGIFPKPKR